MLDTSDVNLSLHDGAEYDDTDDPEQLNKPLGGHISSHLRRNINAGNYVNLSQLLLADGLADQQHQEVTLHVMPVTHVCQLPKKSELFHSGHPHFAYMLLC